MAYNFEPLRTLTGTEKDKLDQVYRHLYKFSGELTRALNALDANQVQVSQGVAEAQRAAVAAGGGDDTTPPSQAYQNMRALIIKTADTVRAEMDVITETLKKDYVAVSEFGAFQEELINTITTTAEGVVMGFDYESRLDAVDDSMAGFESYKVETEQYIKIGVVHYNEDGSPEAGVVVGKNLSRIIVDDNEIVTSPEMYACFTSERLSFWKNGVEQAYFSNETLYVTDINVTNSINLSDKWKIDTTNGFSIKWVG